MALNPATPLRRAGATLAEAKIEDDAVLDAVSTGGQVKTIITLNPLLHEIMGNLSAHASPSINRSEIIRRLVLLYAAGKINHPYLPMIRPMPVAVEALGNQLRAPQ